ncbi:hypothetical protein Dimus_002819 [Dionaea muscipula]
MALVNVNTTEGGSSDMTLNQKLKNGAMSPGLLIKGALGAMCSCPSTGLNVVAKQIDVGRNVAATTRTKSQMSSYVKGKCKGRGGTSLSPRQGFKRRA